MRCSIFFFFNQLLQVLGKYRHRAATTQEDINFTPYNLIKRKKAALEKYGHQLKAEGVDLKWVTRGAFNEIFPPDSKL